MVKTTAPDDEDWPKAHKYDNLDFTYDVKSEKVEEAEKKSSTDDIRLNRPFKKFPEGKGPPADPTYNFLADAERDGKVPASDKTNDRSKDWRGNNNNNGTGPGLNRRSNYNNSFNRGKGGAKAKATNTKTKQQNSMDETSSRKSDSDRSSCDEKVKRTKSIEGNWREKSIEEKKKDSDKDETKLSDGQIKLKINEKSTSSNSSQKAANKLSVHQRLGSKPRSDVNNLPEKLSDLSIEKRGNITVSITKDGEVKSVKCKSIKYQFYGGNQFMIFYFSGSNESHRNWPCRNNASGTSSSISATNIGSKHPSNYRFKFERIELEKCHRLLSTATTTATTGNYTGFRQYREWRSFQITKYSRTLNQKSNLF